MIDTMDVRILILHNELFIIWGKKKKKKPKKKVVSSLHPAPKQTSQTLNYFKTYAVSVVELCSKLMKKLKNKHSTLTWNA